MVNLDLPPAPAAVSWTNWQWHPSTLLGVALLAAGYAWVAGPLRQRLHAPQIPPGRVVAFGAGLAVILVALNGPLHQLSDDYLFSAHMMQHPLLLSFAMPILLLAGLPGWSVDWAVRPPAVAAIGDWLSKPLIAFVIANVTLAAWHFPPAYERAMEHHWIHVVMHLTMMITAVIAWWPVLSPSDRFRMDYPAQMLFLFAMGLPMSGVGALITLADTPLYPWYANAPRVSGLSALDDQRLGGLLMWIPGMLVYWSAMTVVWFRWARRDEERPGLD